MEIIRKKLLPLKQYLYRSSVSLKNKIYYGHKAPSFGELIYVNPGEHETYLPVVTRTHSGKVMGGDWDLEPKGHIEDIPRFQFCKMRWEDNIPWEKTGIYKYMLQKIDDVGSVDDCYNLEDIILRYQKLDKLFDHVKETRTFKTQKELDPSAFNENGGLLFHIDRNNKLIFGGGGMHRFSMAKILKLEKIPAQLGLLHPEALSVWKKHKKI